MVKFSSSRNKKSMKKRNLLIAILIVAMLAFSVAGTYIFMYFSSGKNPTEYKKTNATSQSNKSNNNSAINNNSDSMNDNEDDSIINPYDWDKIAKTNKDIYAYIYIPGTKIELPVAQSDDSKDDSFYLTHNEKGNYEFSGCIYSEKINSTDFTDPVTVFYGHNMLNGTMFAHLHYFEKKDFFDKHEYFYVYTPSHKLTYRVYSAYVYDDTHILKTFDFSDIQVRMDYFKTTLNPSVSNANVRKDVALTQDSKILTLSTCTSGKSNTRYIVNGLFIKDDVTD